MDTIKIWNDDPSERQAREIAARIADGEIAIIPTDTLYGIICDSLNPKAIERICRLKGINPEKTHLSILCSDISMAAEYARYDNYAFRLLKDLTPGPYTFIFRSAPTLPKAFKGRKSVGVRIPANETVRKIVKALGHPLMTTTIDYETEDYAVNPELIAEAHEKMVDFVVMGEDGGTVPSTVIDCTGREPELVRAGLGEYSGE